MTPPVSQYGASDWSAARVKPQKWGRDSSARGIKNPAARKVPSVAVIFIFRNKSACKWLFFDFKEQFCVEGYPEIKPWAYSIRAFWAKQNLASIYCALKFMNKNAVSKMSAPSAGEPRSLLWGRRPKVRRMGWHEGKNKNANLCDGLCVWWFMLWRCDKLVGAVTSTLQMDNFAPGQEGNTLPVTRGDQITRSFFKCKWHYSLLF